MWLDKYMTFKLSRHPKFCINSVALSLHYTCMFTVLNWYILGRQMFRRNNLQLAVERLPSLHQYIQNLLRLPATVSQCQHVIQFLRSNWPEDRLMMEERKEDERYCGYPNESYGEDDYVEMNSFQASDTVD